MRRAGRLNPFEDIRRDDAERVMKALQSLDKDHWAEEWSKIGLGYEEKADARAGAGAPGGELAELYMHAFDACRVGRYPTPNSPGKLRPTTTRCACSARRRNFSRRRSKSSSAVRGARSSSAICSGRPAWRSRRWSALGRRRRLEGRSAAHRQGGDGAGIASFTIDMPGTGENPVLYAIRWPSARSWRGWIICRSVARSTAAGRHLGRQLRRVLGGAARLRGRRPHQGRGIPRRQFHFGFQKEWLIPAFTTGGATYLFGAHSLLEAAAAPWAPSHWRNFWKPHRAFR